jgi:hypothetical protein
MAKANPTPQEAPGKHSGRQFPRFEKARPVKYNPDALAEAQARLKDLTQQQK